MSPERQQLIVEPPIRFVLQRILTLSKRMHRVEPVVRFISDRLIVLEIKVIDRYVPDRVLLFWMRLLDYHVPRKAIEVVIDEVDRHIPPRVRSSLIAAADDYLPDTAASSRKVSTVIAGVGKYVPDRIIPEDSLDNWSKLKLRFHIPTLLSRGQAGSRKD
jgi:hypothetical protein